MKKLKKIQGKALPLMLNNIDTDQIMPGKYLVWITNQGYDQVLFENLRYNPDGSINQNFPLNNPEYQGAKILISGNGFGSGSSREHAVWALMQYGFQAVIAPSFHDIFKNNAASNGLLLISLEQNLVEHLADMVSKSPKTEFVIDIPKQEIEINNQNWHSFEISPFLKEKFLNGLDDVNYVLSKEKAIQKWEELHD
ncbi:MAG: 3-isopropylmalate dehydratase small subunit [bacterium]